MKILKWVFIIITALLAIVVGIGLVQPKQFSVSRSLVVQAPAETIYPLLATPTEWQRWSVWNRRDPAMTLSFSGPANGKGASWSWQSKSQGNGSMSIVDAVPNQKLVYELHIENMNASSGTISMTPEGNAVRVTWRMDGNSEGNFMMRLFTPFMDKMIGGDFEAGLTNLKQLAESTK